MPPPAPAVTTDESSPRYAGWRVVAVCFAMALFCWGFGFYGHGVYLAELQRIHGWPASLIGGASTAYYFFSAILVVFVSDALSRFGSKRCVLLGLVCLATSVLLLPVVRSPWQLYAAYLLMAVAWATMSLAAITNIVGLWFRQKRGLAISLALNGASFGGIVMAPLLIVLIDGLGFATALSVAVGAMVLILGTLVVVWIEPANQRGFMPPGFMPPPEDAPASPAAARWTKGRALRDRHFWGVSGAFALAITAQVGFIVHQIAFLAPTLGRTGAGLAVAVTTTMAVIGRVGLGFVIDRLDQRAAAAVSFVSQALALVVMSVTDSPTVLIGACAVYGFSVGNVITFPALIMQREFDPAAFGMLMGLSSAIGQFAYAFGPGLLGLLRDATGTYTAALLVCAALYLVATAIILIRPRHDDPGVAPEPPRL